MCLTPCLTQNASEALWDLPEDCPSGTPPSGEFLEAAADACARAGSPVAVHVEQAAILVLAIIATDEQTRVGRIIALFIV